MQKTPTPDREKVLCEIAKSHVVCQSQDCPIRERCLRNILKDYVPSDYPVVTNVNLRNPKMQTADCPQYCPDEPVRMPVGLKRMYYNMPHHLERAIKNHLINLFSRKRYYEYHGGKRPVTPDVERIIRQVLNDFGWQQEPVFDNHVEEYL